MVDAIAVLKEVRELGSHRGLSDVEMVLSQFDYEAIRQQERARYRYEIWDKQSEINGIKPDVILERVARFPDGTPGEVYLVYVDDRLVYLQTHDPDQSGFVPMTREAAIEKAEKTIDELVEQAVDAKVRTEAVRRVLALLEVWADKGEVFANGQDTALITASSPDLQDGDKVTFDIPGVGSVEVTAAGGKAVTTFTTTVPGDWPITASHPTLGSDTVLVRGV